MRQRKITSKAGNIPGRKTNRTEQGKLSKAVSWAQIVTAGALLLTLGAAIYAAVTAYKEYKAVYNQSQAAYNDYQARTRPYLVIKEFQFYETNSDDVYLLIDVTNSGERPATNISIQHIEVCVVTENLCKRLQWTIERGKIEPFLYPTILYPGRTNTSRLYINKDDYDSITSNDEIIVTIEYSYEDKIYSYEASLRLRPNSSEWRTENESGN